MADLKVSAFPFLLDFFFPFFYCNWSRSFLASCAKFCK